MVYIKRLKLKGFKSFAEPTVLSFEKGFNTVIGANGSGKSNVFDAMCFVLGRLSSKELRTEKLGNLVFNGGKHLKPAKEAEVSIYLSNEKKELLNTDLDEIKVSRVVSKTGQSTYLLNNNKVTRTEIVELLSKAHINPDGYNIILQGDIMRIVNMTTVERRELIEEISNISGYEEKREKSIKKLEKVEQDLKESDLLMEEKTKYLKELKGEKEQAEKYLLAKEELNFTSLLFLKAKKLRNEKIKEEKQERLKKVETQLQEQKVGLDAFEKENAEIESKITSLEKEIEVQSHESFISLTNRITALDAEVNNLKEKEADLKKQNEEAKGRSVTVKRSIEETKKEITKKESEVKVLENERKEEERKLKEFEKELSLLKSKFQGEKSLREREELDEQYDVVLAKRSEKQLLRQENAVQAEKLNTKIEHLQDEQKRFEERYAENASQVKQLDSLRKELKRLIMEVSQHANRSSELSSKLHSFQKEYTELGEEQSRLRVKLEASKDYGSTNRAVESMLEYKKKDPLVHGSVSELGSAPEKYAAALESAGGKSLFNIVVEDDKVAVKYIKELREKKIGSATFLPLNKVHAKYNLPQEVLSKKGVIDYALNVLKFDKRYEHIFHLIFGDTLIIQSIDDARSIGIGDYRMVTLEGDLVAKTGAMSGGYSSRKKGLGLFKDEKLSSRFEEMESRLGALKNSIDLLKEEKDEVERKLSDLRYEKIDVEAELAKVEKLLSLGGKDVDSLKKDLEALYSDKAVVDASLKKLDKDLQGLEEELSRLQEKKKGISGKGSNSAFASLEEIEKKKDAQKELLLKKDQELGRLNIQLDNVLKSELNNMEKILKESSEASLRYAKDLSELGEKRKKLESELIEKRKEEKELSKGYKDLIAKRDTYRQDKVKLEQKYEKEFEKFDKIKEQATELRYALSEYESLQKNLDEELEETYRQIKAELTEREGEEKVESRLEELLNKVEQALKKESHDVKELQNKVNSLKMRISSYGSLNMRAVEIYDKINAEFQALLEKRETLNIEKKEILELIAEIDEKKKEKFMETFTTLREHFKHYFERLSTKGMVDLVIENEKDLFNSGVEIVVHLSSKNRLDIKSLSGGEKTITAVAFIFAVQEFNPASFYLLDEIDAALDIMNCEKLGKLIRENAHKAQYVVVSHSEYFVQSSEAIYGVVMNENKVSNVLSLDLKETKDYLDDSSSEASS